MAFQDDVKKWSETIVTGMSTKIKRYARAAFSYCIQGSPVLTGRYRASWRIGCGQPDPSSVPELPKEAKDSPIQPDEAIQLAEAALNQYKLGDNIYVTNSVPYADVLEQGSSSKAPVGVLSVAAEKVAIDAGTGAL